MTESRESHIGDGPPSAGRQPVAILGDSVNDLVPSHLTPPNTESKPRTSGHILYPSSIRPDSKVLSAFPQLNEEGIFGIIPGGFSIDGYDVREWASNLGEQRKAELRRKRTDFEIRMLQVQLLLGVDSLDKIPLVLDPNSQEREKAIKSATRRTANLHGLDKRRSRRGNFVDKDDAELAGLMSELAKNADNAIQYQLKKPYFTKYADILQMSQEVVGADNPADLLCLVLDSGYSDLIRSQAKRKLLMMDIAATLLEGPSPEIVKKQLSNFMRLVDDFALEGQRGKVQTAYLVSDHEESRFSAINPKYFTDEAEADRYRTTLKYGTKDTIRPRTFLDSNGAPTPIFFDTRFKDDGSQMEKQMRRGSSRMAVHDLAGIMVVLPNEQAIEEFKFALIKGGFSAGVFIDIVKTEEKFEPKYQESSEELSQTRYIIKYSGVEIEMIAYTYEGFINSKRKDIDAHDEFEARRVFDTGLATAFFPPSIYFEEGEVIDWATVRDEYLERRYYEKRNQTA